MTLFRFPDALGGAEHDGVVEGETVGFNLPDLFGTLWLHVSDLAPVDTTPAEPEPGAWLIGETPTFGLVLADAPTTRRWAWHDGKNLGAGEWYHCWDALGGPGVTIRRLIPEPAPEESVELPWAGFDWVVQTDGNKVVVSTPDDRHHELGPVGAKTFGWALLTAARAAREATR